MSLALGEGFRESPFVASVVAQALLPLTGLNSTLCHCSLPTARCQCPALRGCEHVWRLRAHLDGALTEEGLSAGSKLHRGPTAAGG